MAGRAPSPADRERFAHPAPRIAEARWLAARGARAAIDVSDGLASDARHLAAASGVRLALDIARLPRVRGVSAREAAASGEEYELLVALPADAPVDPAAFAARFGIPLTAVGEATAGGPSGIDLTDGGARVEFPRGWDHFST
jgi:thiamine-monophosphate kinase